MISTVEHRPGLGGRIGRPTWAALLVAGVLVSMSIVGCGPSDTTSDAGGAPASSAGDAVPEALQFTAPLVGGGQFDGASFAGRPVAFWFWAPT